MKDDCKGKQHNCGEFTENEDKETKIKHLKECKENLLKKIQDIDAALDKIES